jgi:hypothetical protein
MSMPHRTKLDVIKRLVKEEILTGPNKGVMWGREVKNLNHLLAKYPDEAFWTGLNPGYTMHSLAFFKTPRGADELETAWRYYKLTSSQNQLDKPTKSPMVDMERVELGSALTDQYNT